MLPRGHLHRTRLSGRVNAYECGEQTAAGPNLRNVAGEANLNTPLESWCRDSVKKWGNGRKHLEPRYTRHRLCTGLHGARLIRYHETR
jgi:hypothetical protein